MRGKRARAVLRGGGGRDVTLLPDRFALLTISRF